MKGFIVLMWILWLNLAFTFGVTTIYFARIANWRGFVTAPLFVAVLFFGIKLVQKSRHGWNQDEGVTSNK